MYVQAGRPAFARPCERVHRRTSLMSSSLLLQQCSTCLVRLTLIVFEMGGRWPYSCCFVGCSLQDLFKLLAVFLCSCRQAIYIYIYTHTVALIHAHVRISLFMHMVTGNNCRYLLEMKKNSLV